MVHLYAIVTKPLLRYNPQDVYVTIVHIFLEAFLKMDNDDSYSSMIQNQHRRNGLISLRFRAT